MALQKQQIPIDLISGTETKINNQINEKNQDMINVVYSGNLTVKKMNGYDLLASLPASEYYSSIFTRGNDLLAQTEKGSYKYYENITSFKNISNIGSSYVDTVDSYGETFCAGTNYNLHIGIEESGDISTGIPSNLLYLVHTFTDKKGAVLNKIKSQVYVSNTGAGLYSNQAEIMRWVQVVELANVFYIVKPTLLNKVTIERYTYSAITNTFSLSNSIIYDGTTLTNIPYNSLLSSYLYIDSTNGLYWAELDTAGGRTISTLNQSTLAVITSATFGGTDAISSLKISQRSASSIYLTWATYGIAPNYLVSLQSNIYNSPLTLVSTTTIVPGFITQAGIHPVILHYMTSDTTAKWMYFLVGIVSGPAAGGTAVTEFQQFCVCVGLSRVNAGVVYEGLTPIGEVFLDNGSYYFPAVMTIGLNQVYVVMNIDTESLVASFNYSKIAETGFTEIQNYNLPANIAAPTFFSLKKMYKENNAWFIPTKDKMPAELITSTGFLYSPIAANTRLMTLNLNASLVSSHLEMIGRTSIFNGQPSYFDGYNLSELGFLSSPFIYAGRWFSTGGTLPAGTYQVCAIYKYKDAFGNIFKSDLSNIWGSKSTITTTGATSYLDFYIHLPLVTSKDIVEVIVYVKKDADPFVKVQSFINNRINSRVNIIVTSYTALTGSFALSDPDAALYATSTFAPGGDYPTEPITSTISSALHEDRIFTISRDHTNSLNFSQQRLEGVGIEFNQDIFYLDIFDKRGSYEDKLTGTISMDGRLFVFKEKSVLYIVGSGPSRANTQNDMSSPQLVTTDVGCINSKSIVLTPSGIMFMSDKGIYLLDRKLQVSYVGSSIERFNSRTITSAILLEKVNEIRFGTLEGEVLVYNYYSNAWSWFTGLPSVSACIWKGQYTLLLTSGKVYVESTSHKKIVESGVSTAIVQKISSPWIRGNGSQAWEKVYETLILGDFKSDHNMQVSFYYDYEQYASDVYTLVPLASGQYNIVSRPTNTAIESGASTDGVYQLLIDMVRKNCQSFRIEIQDIPLNIASNSGECFALSTITVTFGVKKGPAKLPAVKTY